MQLKWKGNVNMDLYGLGWEGLDSIHLAQDRDKWREFVNTIRIIQAS